VKITKVEPKAIDHYLYVRIHTDEGITGLGESGAHGYQKAAEGALEAFRDYLIGEDPLRIEHHWQTMYRWSHFRGAAIMGAISAIDIALWDIAGKFFGVPVYQLLGGKCRDKARVYIHVKGETREELVQGCIKAKEEGYTAVGHLTPFLDDSKSIRYFRTHSDKMSDAIDAVRQYRDAVGDDVDLCIEIHRRLSPAEAIVLGRGIEPYRPFFYEDPILPDNMDAMAEVAQKIGIPIATGERLHTMYEFEMLLKRNAVQYVRPDVCLAGGISHSKKIAAIAEAHHVGVVPHNPRSLSPVSTAACLQLVAAIPNFALQEYPRGEDEAPKSKIVKRAYGVENGFISIPDVPGIGAELVEGAEEKYPFQLRTVRTRLHEDGSVVDQ